MSEGIENMTTWAHRHTADHITEVVPGTDRCPECPDDEQIVTMTPGYADEMGPDTDRVPTDDDRIMAGMLSTIWPMSTRHPFDSLHLAIFVNDLMKPLADTITDLRPTPREGEKP
jgi:hypothetical protein